MKLKVNRTRVISFSTKSNLLGFVYKLCEASVIASKIWMYLLTPNSIFTITWTMYIFTQLGCWGFIRTVNFSLSTHYKLVAPKSVYAFFVLISITSPDPCKFARIKRKFVSRCHFRALSHRSIKMLMSKLIETLYFKCSGVSHTHAICN